jgi:hypothetical protein
MRVSRRGHAGPGRHPGRGCGHALDFTRPVAVMLIAAIHCVQDDDEALSIVGHLMDACPPGSYLAITHATSDFNPGQVGQMNQLMNESAMAEKRFTRDRAGVARLVRRL